MPVQDDTSSFVRNLTLEARRNRFSPVAGRDDEIDQVLEILGQKRKSNVLIIGPAGAGKTAIAEGIAILSARYPERLPPALHDIQVMQLDTAGLISGSGLVGEHERRVKALFDELGKKSVLFIDEVHTLFGAGGREGKTDTAQLLKPHLARDAFKIIAATTTEEYSRILAGDGAFSRRFQIVHVKPLSLSATVDALVAYAQYRGRKVSRRLLGEIARLAGIACPTRAQPDPAIDIFERALSIADWQQSLNVGIRHIEKAVARTAGLPVDYKNRLHKLSATIDDKQIAKAAQDLLALLQGKERKPLVLECEPAVARKLAVGLDQVLHQGVLEINGQRSGREIYGAEPGLIGHDNRLPMHTLLETPFKIVRIMNSNHDSLGQRLQHDAKRGWFEDTKGRRFPISIAIIETPVERKLGF